MDKLTIGIIAHVDSGKTTLSEAILYKTGITRSLGSVNKGSSHLDTNQVERDRGITIFSSGASFIHKDVEFTLIDTPGHVDFSPETERVLRVIDCALLVISGTDGIQSHTMTLWRLLENYKVPTIIFINKMDITALSHRELMDELKYKLGDGCIDFNATSLESFSDELAMCDEVLMESFAAGEEFHTEDIRNAISKRLLFPCFFGSALRGDGVNILLDGIADYVAPPKYGDVFGAKVYKITQDKSDKIAHVKVTGGVLKVKDTLSGKHPDGREWTEKINQIRVYSGEKYKTVTEAPAGTVCALTGLSSAYPGMGLGFEKDSGAAYLEPVLSYRVELPEGVDTHTALAKFRELEAEEPALHIIYNERRSEIYFGIMGEVQLEVLTRIISERFGMDVTFSDGSISYKETIRSSVIGVGHYEPLRHYAEVQLLLEPLARGEGLKFAVDDECDLAVNFKRLVLSHLYEKTHIGVLTGSPITDMKITLIAGRAHPKHTEGGDFRQATWRALRQGLMCSEAVLLEPWYDFRLELPAEAVGRAMSDITMMGGKFSEPEMTADGMVLTGKAPVAKMRAYHRELISYTKGTGKLFTSLGGYAEAVEPDAIIAESGYDAERDTENPADSVFCEHGAGFVVKWDEVWEHKHLESGVELDTPDTEVSNDRAARYLKSVASDNELMRIFERTYGPIKRKKFNEPKVRHAVPTPKKRTTTPPKNSYSGSEYLLVDGYNIIYAWDDLRLLAEKGLDIARNSLIDRLCNYRGFRECDVIVVFDAYKVKRNHGDTEKINGLTVVYTKEAETADTYIEKVSKELSKNHRVRVATSDADEQLIILGNGAIRVSARGLRAELNEVERSIREFIESTD